MLNYYKITILFNCLLTTIAAQKYIDIYTNYPNLEKMIKEESFDGLLPKNSTKFVKMQSESTENFQQFRKPKTESHVQKISARSFTTNNSKQLERNENFFTKINSAIRNQFSRLFKFQTGEDESKMQENKQGPVKSNENDTKKRFLNLFTVLQFENSRCSVQAGLMTYEGTCYHRLECSDRNGISMGSCAKGYGVCCIFRYTCGGVTSQNTSYFECDTGNIPLPTIPTTMPTTISPPIDPRLNITALLNRYQLSQQQDLELDLLEWNDGPEGRQTTGTSTCVFTVNKRRPDVKQLRIDFEDFDIRGPTNGVCSTDRLIISGGNINSQIPIICGYNTGQHIYVDVSDVPGPIQLSVFTNNPLEKRFRIKVSQIRGVCANSMNCLQYYTGPTGIVQTLNYSPSPRGLGPAQYFNNLNYAICIRKEPGYCTITYSNVQNGIESPFRLINVDSNGNSLIPPGQAGVEIFNCPDDYIVIDGVRLCGDRFNDGSTNPDFRQNSPVTDTSGGPFIIPVRTNENTVARGFQLFYTQNRCV